MMDFRELENRMAKNEDIRRERDNDRLVAKALGKGRTGQGWFNGLKRQVISLLSGRPSRSPDVIPREAVMTPQPQK